MDKAKLLSCMEEIRNIIGESVSDGRIVEAIMNNNYDYTKALDMILTTENSNISQPKLVKNSRDIKSQTVIEKGIFNFTILFHYLISQPTEINCNLNAHLLTIVLF